MPTVVFSQPFRFSPNGYSITTYPAGEPVEVSEECARVAAQAGVLTTDEPLPQTPDKPRARRNVKER